MTIMHTSGPWMVFPRTNGKLGSTVAFEGTDELTATDICLVMPEDDNGEAIRTADANAALISAAPDLLKSLSTLERWLSYAVKDPMDAAYPAILEARAALKKAVPFA